MKPTYLRDFYIRHSFKRMNNSHLTNAFKRFLNESKESCSTSMDINGFLY